MPRKKREIKSPKDLLPELADLENDEMAVEVDDVDIVPEEVAELEVEEPLDISHFSLVDELSADPVRLYLREIGQVKLLDSDSEFRLSTMIEAQRLFKNLQNRTTLRDPDQLTVIYRAVIDEMLISLRRFEEDAGRLGVTFPDMVLVLASAQALRQGWDIDSPSYLRAFLNNGQWGHDTMWNGLAANAFNLFVSLYMLPPQLARWISKYCKQHESGFPSARSLYRNLPAKDDLLYDTQVLESRSDDANQAIIRANFSLSRRS